MSTTIATSSFASSVLSKAQSSLPITSDKNIGWKCLECHGTWKETVYKRAMYKNCPECTPHATRKSVVTHKPAELKPTPMETIDTDMAQLEAMLSNTHISPPPKSEDYREKSHQQIADDAFMTQQMNLLGVTKPILTFHRMLDKVNKEMETTEDEDRLEELQAERISLKKHYVHKVREITPIYTPIPKLELNMKKYNAIHTHLHTILSDDDLDVFERIIEYAFPVDEERVALYRERYHKRVLKERLRFMARYCNKREWKETILPIHREYEAFEVDLMMFVKLGDHVCMWINNMENDVTYDKYMWGFRMMENVRMQMNEERRTKHSAEYAGELDGKWKYVEDQ